MPGKPQQPRSGETFEQMCSRLGLKPELVKEGQKILDTEFKPAAGAGDKPAPSE